MTLLRPILSGLLVVALLITAQTAALARTAPDAAGTMVLCTGTGPVVMAFDAQGNPIEPSHVCPDCAMSIWDLATSDPHWPCPDASASRAWQPTVAVQPVSLEARDPSARGPPRSV